MNTVYQSLMLHIGLFQVAQHHPVFPVRIQAIPAAYIKGIDLYSWGLPGLRLRYAIFVEAAGDCSLYDHHVFQQFKRYCRHFAGIKVKKKIECALCCRRVWRDSAMNERHVTQRNYTEG